MQLKPQSSQMKDYLKETDIIDYTHPEINHLAYSLYDANDIEKSIKDLYEYVRDEIHHSADFKGDRVTCKASHVLETGEGICFAKAHLLASLYRALQIPAGFCYQKLRLTDTNSPLILHGLIAIYLPTGNWLRLDPRGNRKDINAQCLFTKEQLAFNTQKKLGEEDLPIIYTEPNKKVVKTLTHYKTFEDLWENLPREL